MEWNVTLQAWGSVPFISEVGSYYLHEKAAVATAFIVAEFIAAKFKPKCSGTSGLCIRVWRQKKQSSSKVGSLSRTTLELDGHEPQAKLEVPEHLALTLAAWAVMYCFLRREISVFQASTLKVIYTKAFRRLAKCICSNTKFWQNGEGLPVCLLVFQRSCVYK